MNARHLWTWTASLTLAATSFASVAAETLPVVEGTSLRQAAADAGLDWRAVYAANREVLDGDAPPRVTRDELGRRVMQLRRPVEAKSFNMETTSATVGTNAAAANTATTSTSSGGGFLEALFGWIRALFAALAGAFSGGNTDGTNLTASGTPSWTLDPLNQGNGTTTTGPLGQPSTNGGTTTTAGGTTTGGVSPQAGNADFAQNLPIPRGQYRITTYYNNGTTDNARNETRTSRRHGGIDLAKPTGGSINGKPIACIGRGKVSRRALSSSYGWVVYVDHTDAQGAYVGYQSRYAHMLQAPSVSADATVEPQTVLGLVGSTGRSSGPHLHFEILEGNRSGDGFTYPNGGRKDPEFFLAFR